MVKHIQTIHWLLPMDCLSVFDHFVVSALKELNQDANKTSQCADIPLKIVKEDIDNYSNFISLALTVQ